MSKPRLIVVAYPLGRVGSSALMGLLHLAGVNVGDVDRVSNAAPMNPKGFFEIPAQEEFLRRVYASVYPHLSMPPPMDVLHALGGAHASEYRDLLRAELGNEFPAAVKSQWFLTLPFLHEMRGEFDVRVLVMERRLCDQVSSLLRVYRQTDRPVLKHVTRPWATAYVRAWKRFGKEVRESYEFPYLVLSFERLMRDPVGITREMTAFAGVPCPPVGVIRDWLDPSLVNRKTLAPNARTKGPEEADRLHGTARAARRAGPRLSVVVNTLNEERNLEDCLSSVRDLADEIVVVDMHSRDRTVEIARRYTDKVYFHEQTGVVEPAREFAISKATGDWILILDADERATPALAAGLRDVISNPKGVDVFRIPRKNFIAGRWMEGTGLGMDVERQPRLFRKGALRWSDRIHGGPTILGAEGALPLTDEARIDHLAYRSLFEFVERLNRYTDHEARLLEKDGAVWSLDRMLAATREELENRYDPDADGMHSLVLSSFMAFYRFLTWAKLWETKGFPQEPLPVTAGELLSLLGAASPEPAGAGARAEKTGKAPAPASHPQAATPGHPAQLGNGFYGDEGGWCWMSEEGEVEISPDALPAEVRFSLTCAARQCYTHFPLKVEISVGPTPVETVTFDSDEQCRTVCVNLDERRARLPIRIRSVESFVPADLGINQDGRRLSVRMSGLAVERSRDARYRSQEPPKAVRDRKDVLVAARSDPGRTLKPARGKGRCSIRLGLIVADSKPVEERGYDDAPLAFGYFASYLARHMPGCEVVYAFTLDELLAEGVDVVGITATTEEFERAKALAARVKEQCDLPVLIGGVHISVLPQNLTSDMDVAVIGEGEVTLTELLKCFAERGKRFLAEDLKKVRGIAFREEGSLVRTPPRPPIEDLDTLPFPDRRKIWVGRPSDRCYLFTSRGCRYRCAFCASSRFWGRLRCFSPEYVVREIDAVRRDFGIRSFHFFDDLFISPRGRLREICRLLEDRGLTREMTFSGAVTAKLVDEELCKLLERANFRSVMFGAESFSPRVLDYLKCGTVKPEDNQRALDLLHKFGIDAYVHLIYASPVESREDLMTTFRAVEENLLFGKLRNVGRGILRPYPGTPVWEEAKRRGLVSEDMNWDLLRPYPGTPLWEEAKAKGFVSEDTHWERIRSFAGPYMGKIPEEEFHRLLLDHEERCMALVPDKDDLWIEWGVSRDRLARTLAGRRPGLIAPHVDFSRDHAQAQLGEGWYALEGPQGARYRWMARRSVTYLRAEDENAGLVVKGSAPLERFEDHALGLKISVDGRLLLETSIRERDFAIGVDLPEDLRNGDLLKVEIEADKTFKAPPDVRELSVLVTALRFVPAAVAATAGSG